MFLVQRSQHVLEIGVMWIWLFLLTQSLSISIRLDRRSTYVLTMLWDYILGQLYMCCTFQLGSCPRSLGINHAFTVPSVRFHHVLRVCTTLLLCPRYVYVISYCTIHMFYMYIPKLSKWIIALCIHLQFYQYKRQEKCVGLNVFLCHSFSSLKRLVVPL